MTKRRILLAAAAAGAVVGLAWPPPLPVREAAPQHVASLVTPSPAESPTPTDDPTPTPPPSPTATPVPDSTAAPPPAPAAEPAHPPAPPPPRAAPAPAAVTVAVPVYHQVYNLSCEESSLAMVAAFYGNPISDQDVLNFIGVDLAHSWTGAGGGDPYVNFVGDPNGSEVRNTGYGVYWPPIQAAAGHFGAPVAGAGQGVSPAAVYAAAAAGRPVIVWVTFDLAWHARSDYVAYDGATIPYAGPEEHAMVVTGVSDASVRLNDPDRGQYWVTRSRFETAYGVYGQMAVLFAARGTPVTTPTPTPTPTPTATPAPTPTPSATPTPTPTPSPTPTATPSPTPTPTPTASP